MLHAALKQSFCYLTTQSWKVKNSHAWSQWKCCCSMLISEATSCTFGPVLEKKQQLLHKGSKAEITKKNIWKKVWRSSSGNRKEQRKQKSQKYYLADRCIRLLVEAHCQRYVCNKISYLKSFFLNLWKFL